MVKIIKVPQQAIVKHCPNLNLIDCAILYFALGYQYEAYTKQDQFGLWFLMEHKVIIERLPIIKLKARQGIAERIQKLIDYEILVKHPAGKHQKRAFYMFLEHPILSYY